MNTNKKTRSDFSSQIAAVAAQGFDFMGKFGALASAYIDMFGAELTADDYEKTALEGMNPADILLAVQTAGELDALLNANNGEKRKALRRLAQYSR